MKNTKCGRSVKKPSKFSSCVTGKGQKQRILLPDSSANDSMMSSVGGNASDMTLDDETDAYDTGNEADESAFVTDTAECSFMSDHVTTNRSR